MTRVCTVCRHEKRYDIDAILADRSASYRDIARRFSLSKDAVSRHVSGGHLSELVALAADAERAAQADSLLDRLEALQSRTEEALKKAEEQDNPFATFRGISEMRCNLELIGEVTKELDRTPTLNLHLNPQYIAVRSAVQQAVEPYPEVAEAISRAMLQLEESEERGNGSESGAGAA
jgi:DNA-binding transcriptional ArsR family regulator